MAKVMVYTGLSCPFCDDVKDFLASNKIEFEERNISENAEYSQELEKKNGFIAVPITDVDGTIIIGFDEQKLRETLGL